MPFGTPLSHFAARLFGAAAPGAAEAVDPELVRMGVEAVVDVVDPRLRTLSRYPAKIGPCIAQTITYLRELGQQLPAPIALSRAAWVEDPFINAVFATRDDVPIALGDSRELRDFFAAPQNCGATEAHALLGMLKTERQVFAPAIVDGELRQDVARTTVSFSHHRLLCAATDAAACRLEVGARILRRLAELALGRIAALGDRATGLEQRKAVLGAKLRMLHLRRDGLAQIAEDLGDIVGQIASIERELQATVDDYLETKASLATLETRIEQIRAVFGTPARYLKAERTTLRVSRLGYKVPAQSDEPATQLTLHELTIGDGLKAAIAFVRCPRAELPSAEDLAVRANRALL